MLVGLSRGEFSGTASGADTVSLDDASVSGQAPQSSSVQKRKESQRKSREQGNLVETFDYFLHENLIDLYFECFF